MARKGELPAQPTRATGASASLRRKPSPRAWLPGVVLQGCYARAGGGCVQCGDATDRSALELRRADMTPQAQKTLLALDRLIDRNAGTMTCSHVHLYRTLLVEFISESARRAEGPGPGADAASPAGVWR